MKGIESWRHAYGDFPTGERAPGCMQIDKHIWQSSDRLLSLGLYWQFIHAAFSFPCPDVSTLQPAFLPPLFLWACILFSVILVSNTLKGNLRGSREEHDFGTFPMEASIPSWKSVKSCVRFQPFVSLKFDLPGQSFQWDK